jgi:hypothetical protein
MVRAYISYSFAFLAVARASWITQEVQDRLCIAETGNMYSKCEGEVPTCTGSEVACSLSFINEIGDHFEQLRGRLISSVTPERWMSGEFEFVQQLSAPNYGDFLLQGDISRKWKSQKLENLREFLGYSSEAYITLLQIFIKIPGADWVGSFYEPVCEQLVNHDAVNWIREIVLGIAPLDSKSQGPFVRGAAAFSDSKGDYNPTINRFEEDIVHLLTHFIARTVVRFTDDEHVEYARLLHRTVGGLMSSVTSDLEIPVEVSEWLYFLYTRTTLLLRPKMQSFAIRDTVFHRNSRHRGSTKPHDLLGSLEKEFPYIEWSGVITESDFTSLCMHFAGNEVLHPYQTAIGISILRSIARKLGLSDPKVGTLQVDQIVIEKRFTAEDHHFLDGILVIACTFAQSARAPLSSLVSLLKVALVLNLESIEVQSDGLRSELEFKFIRAPVGHAELESTPTSSEPEMRTKERMYISLYSMAARMN